ncbi:MAG: hypothetical protein NWF00_11950 [Candidatus Bathyarchaeota archaeon]|nr:hypothetical protein [Candidatus Bathyarchaeota archaeon]
MGAVLSKIPKQNKPNYRSFQNTYIYKRRVYEVRSPCQWLTHCDNGKCPAFMCINGNYYCIREGIP